VGQLSCFVGDWLESDRFGSTGRVNWFDEGELFGPFLKYSSVN